jgi:hypothetical protein
MTEVIYVELTIDNSAYVLYRFLMRAKIQYSNLLAMGLRFGYGFIRNILKVSSRRFAQSSYPDPYEMIIFLIYGD